MRGALQAALVLTLVVPMARAQQNVPPPPNPNAPDTAQPAGDNGPSLAATMQFIQGKLSGLGRLDLVLTTDTGDTSPTVRQDLSSVVADAASCTLKMDVNYGPDVNSYSQYFGRFKEVTAITVGDSLGIINKWNESSAITGNHWVAVTPAAYVLTMKAESKAFRIHTVLSPKFAKAIGKKNAAGYQDQNLPTLEFYFRDEDLADRVAKARTHAAELCGAGSKPEPF